MVNHSQIDKNLFPRQSPLEVLRRRLACAKKAKKSLPKRIPSSTAKVYGKRNVGQKRIQSKCRSYVA